MKYIRIMLPTLLLATIITFSQCKKNKDEEPQLPPETTTGAMTFGCKVNGKVFVPKDARGKPGLFVQYVNLGSGSGGGWYLNIPATNWVPSSPESINIGTDSLLISQGQTYQFKNSKGSPRAFYNNRDIFPKFDNDSGSLFISKFDQVNRILSGTFFFVGTSTTSGIKVNVTEGRFDLRY